MITMSYNEALAIQAKQLDYYSQRLSEQGQTILRAAVAVTTSPCSGDPDKPQSIIEINRLVPRGSDIEFLLGIPQPED